MDVILTALFLAVIVPRATSQSSDVSYNEDLDVQLQDCLNQYSNHTANDEDASVSGLWCPAQYDLILCWPPTKAGETAYQPCPPLADQYQTTRAYKVCTENGTWSEEISAADLYLSGRICKCVHCNVIQTINSFGCGLSTLACIVAFLIFLFSRRLWCRRNYIHWHLISSFILTYFVYFIGLGIRTSEAATDIRWLEQAMDTLYYYSLMTNYFWMLVEGLYLHTLVVFALRVDANRISFLIYMFIGWILPTVFVLAWAIVSHLTSGEFAKSLSENGSIQDYICVIGPIGVALFINCIFLVNIMRCLCKKLRETLRNEEQQSWRGAKATMVLVVLLGVHYVVFLIVYPIVESQLPLTATLILHYINTLLTSTQGIQVSVIYVFLNSEVKGSIKRTTVKIMRKQDCPCVRRSLGNRQRNSSYSRWFTDENTCLSTLRSSPSRHPNGGRVNSDMTATINGGIGSGGSEKPPVQTEPEHSPIVEKAEEYYELETMSEKLDENKNGDDKRAVPPQEGVPLLEKRNNVDSSSIVRENGSPQCAKNGVNNVADVKPDETQRLAEDDDVY